MQQASTSTGRQLLRSPALAGWNFRHPQRCLTTRASPQLTTLSRTRAAQGSGLDPRCPDR
ncbi:hypothetical protein SCOCK_150085 [Actinacidiphila cocklensis]|uniref:Uncharacterized protein n=1 Tax=Actinacidiphila cocklensis TaxID=887465 RepID=A0A9W4GP82_9ACTN|nr:hypothetical protein SCOCK_150085 [Actinacidiphila cocklensis]